VLGAALKRAIDDLAAAPGTFLVGMTDRIDQVDQTLLGPARLGRHLEFGRPSLDELREIVSHHAASFLPARQIEAIARSCQGLGRSEVMHWLSEARHRAARDGRQATIDDVLCAMRKGSPGLPRDRLRRIAVRHIGHAAVGLDLGVADDGSVSIVATPDRVGASILSSSSTLETRQGLLDRIATCFGGRAAECVLYGGPSIDRHAQSSDVEQATAIARDFVLGHSLVRGDDLRAAYPACERPLVHRDCRKTRQAISRLLADAEEVAVRIVGRYSQGIARAADALLDRHAMSLADLRSYLGIATPARRPRRG
jgi:ATP-dependent Zn protease